jgi:hypothetical protein
MSAEAYPSALPFGAVKQNVPPLSGGTIHILLARGALSTVDRSSKTAPLVVARTRFVLIQSTAGRNVWKRYWRLLRLTPAIL